MITFKDYAVRRGLTIDNFQHLQYEEYQRWCANRKVEPVSRTEFRIEPSVFVEAQSVDTYDTPEELTAEPEIILEPVPVAIQVDPINWDRIKKSRKSDIQTLCEQRGIEFGDATKKQLITMLKDYEGIE